MMNPMNEKAPCYNKKFGHDFAVAGSDCTQCGINQETLSKELRKVKYNVAKPVKGMHSEIHALAKDISEYCGEPERFGMYLGIIKNLGMRRSYEIFGELRQSEAETKGKLFVYKSKFKTKEDEFEAYRRKREGAPQKTGARKRNNS